MLSDLLRAFQSRRWNLGEDPNNWDRPEDESSGTGDNDTDSDDTTLEGDGTLESLSRDGPPSIWVPFMQTIERMRETGGRRVQRMALVTEHLARMLDNGFFQGMRDRDRASKSVGG